ncbi:hypothetical protein, partial [Halobacillus sp. BBL2006]|uniref:hypothetical protein n=1 Tax=Halobacillus sp. BBL2006 TaxID=1543706 RepID=UPI000541D518
INSKKNTKKLEEPSTTFKYENMESESAEKSEREESTSIEHKSQVDSLIGEFLSMLGESSFSEEEFIQQEESYSKEDPFFDGDYSILKDIVSSIEEGANDESSSFKHYYYSQKEINDEVADPSSSEAEKEFDSFKEEEFDYENVISSKDSSLIFEEISSMLDESPLELDSPSKSIEEFESASSEDEYSFTEDVYSLDDDLSSSEYEIDSSNDQEESSSKDFLELVEEECSSNDSELDCDNEESSTPLIDLFKEELVIDGEDKEESLNCELNCKVERKGQLVRLPVLLSRTVVDIDLMHSLDIKDQVVEIIDVEWSLNSIKTNVVLPTSTVFFKGVLIADIKYVTDHKYHTIRTVKIPVHWDKVEDVRWLHEPVHSKKHQKEYNFKTDHEGSSHYEFYQDFVSPIEEQLQSFQSTWNHTLHPTDKGQKISIQGNVHIRIDLLQQQYIEAQTFCYD